MQTSGFTGETIGRLYEGDRLAKALAEARLRTLSIYAHLDLAALEVPYLPIVNPPLWELAHVAWFQEHWCLRYAASSGATARGSLLPGADALFDSRTVAHQSRWHLPMPAPRVLFDYLKSSLDATLEALQKTPEDSRYFFALSLLHEDMHGEALLMTLQTLALPAPPVASSPPPASMARAQADIAFAGGELMQGTARNCAGFVFDNEKWAHARKVAPFRMARRPVTQGEYAAFVEDGGYARRELWTGEGSAWLDATQRDAPIYWKRSNGEWRVRRFDAWLPLDPQAPMLHLTLHEALAYCRWAGRRLPTESEWEFAARQGGSISTDSPHLDFRHQAPFLSEQPDTAGAEQMIGGVWEWTASPFRPYPGFSADPYSEYSQPWFESHFVLRGGSFATRARLVHERFRNFYLPERADVFNGLRTCAVESD